MARRDQIVATSRKPTQTVEHSKDVLVSIIDEIQADASWLEDKDDDGRINYPARTEALRMISKLNAAGYSGS